jgi:dTDP-4-amino-4,6-dideoxygalactose transaminase
MHIPFNRPYFTGKELDYIKLAVESGKISGDGIFTKKCHTFFEQRYGFKKCLLTSSCTDALEMAALLLNIKEGDEIIAPSYAFVSTVNAFVLRGAKIIFADSTSENPNIDPKEIKKLITKKTKAIIIIHYAGIACDMDAILKIADDNKIFLIEDAAHSIDSFYRDKPLGSLGQLASFSFHETKNVISGEGGMLVINDPHFAERAEIIREKGTDRSKFFRGEIDKYGWVDIGSSFLPSEITAAFLFAQLEKLELIQRQRKKTWQQYYDELLPLSKEGFFQLPYIPDYAMNNGHLFYLVCSKSEERNALIKYLNEKDINAVFHYLSLHQSPYYLNKHDGRNLPNSDHYTNCLVRLPLWFGLTDENIFRIVNAVKQFYSNKN